MHYGSKCATLLRLAIVLPALFYAPASEAERPFREPLPCHGDGRAAVLVIDGQSNAGNHGHGRFSAGPGVVNLGPDGQCFRALDPLLGATGEGANLGTPLADMLVRSGRFARVVLVPVAVGGASIAQLADRPCAACAALAKAGLTPTHIIFQQGETDAGSDTTADQYLAALSRLIGQYRAAGVSAPFLVALATRCDLIRPQNRDAIRAAQRASWGVLAEPGPDMDENDDRSPIDGCHLSQTGIVRAAELWAEYIR